MNLSFDQLLLETAQLVENEIAALLPNEETRLAQAMHYSALSPGKRLRPFMLLCVSDMYEVERSYSLRVAAVIEIIHSYSLIHDDLPAMDDDDFRRGMPSCHKKFDEATAILAGDSLLTLAFEILSDPKTHPDSTIRCNLIKILAENIGVAGIAGGQMLDLVYEREMQADYAQLINMHWMKTSRLFTACCEMGAALGLADAEDKQHLSKYSEYFGLAFQFADDLADIAQQEPLSDNNIVKLIGEKETKLIMSDLITKARNEIAFFEDKGLYLDKLALNV